MIVFPKTGKVIWESPLIDSLRYGNLLYLQNGPARPHVTKARLQIEKTRILSVQSWLKGDAGGSFYKNGCLCTREVLFRQLIKNENKALFQREIPTNPDPGECQWVTNSRTEGLPKKTDQISWKS